MEYTNCFNTYNNISSHQRRSQTLQPNRLPNSKVFILQKYFNSQLLKSNYANIPSSQEDIAEPLQTNYFSSQHHHHHHNHNHHQTLHTRSQSQHSYHTMRQLDYNNYYNVSNSGLTTNFRERPIEGPPDETSVPLNNRPITTLDIMNVCNELELGTLDSPPPLPSRRNYSVHEAEGRLYKMTFSH